MANYDNDELDDNFDETEEEQAAGGGPAPSGNRNLITAIGILGGIFLLLLIALLAVAFFRRQPTPASTGPNIAATNAVIQTANAGTIAAATQAVAKLLTPSITPTMTITPTATKTLVLAPSNTPLGGLPGGGLTPTATGAAVGQVDTRTATVSALLTQRAQTSVAQTQVKTTLTPGKTAVKGSATAQRTGTGTPGMPQSGFADEFGLPGLFALSVGLIVVIVLVRRLRLSASS